MIGGRGAMFALGGLAALLLVLAAVSGWQGTNRLAGRSDDSAAVEKACGLFVEAYGTFDFRDANSYRERLRTLTTGALRAAVTSSQIDSAAIGGLQTVSTRIVRAQATALSDEAATVSVTAEQSRRSVVVGSGQLIDEEVQQRVACRLALEAGSWLVAEFRLESEQPLRSPRS